MEKIVGVAARVNFHTKITTSATGSVMSSGTMSFSVNGLYIEYTGGGSMSLENGDNVVVAGPKYKNGIIEAYAVRNLNSGLLMSEGGSKATSLGIGMAVVGIATMAALVGFVFLYFAYRSLKKASDIKAAMKLVMEHPQLSAK